MNTDLLNIQLPQRSLVNPAPDLTFTEEQAEGIERDLCELIQHLLATWVPKFQPFTVTPAPDLREEPYYPTVLVQYPPCIEGGSLLLTVGKNGRDWGWLICAVSECRDTETGSRDFEVTSPGEAAPNLRIAIGALVGYIVSDLCLHNLPEGDVEP